MAKLYIVGTPIGNLNDMTFRAIDTLKNVDMIACEDTRHSLRLLNHFEIKKPLFACHKYNEKKTAEKIADEIACGKNIALISDAGMPAISDPGAVVVEYCHENGIAVEVVPGPTAVTSAIALSGITKKGFAFLGFLPEKLSDKTALLETYKECPITLAFYVAPHDINKDAKFIASVLGDRKCFVVKELTKIHESMTNTTLLNVNIQEPKGEFVLLVDGAKENTDWQKLSVEEHLQSLIDEGMPQKEAIKKVASIRGVAKNEVYQIAIKMK